MLERKEHSLWCEKYRPSTLDDLIGNDHIKNKIKIYLETNDIPQLLLFGPWGTGKTSTAKIIVNTVECDYLYINAADESGVETVRTKITSFASTIGFSDIKIVILDECLDENTLVWVLRKGKEISCPIKDVDEKNDLVKSYNLKENSIQWRPFNLIDKGNNEVYEIELENKEKIICTSNHRWYVTDNYGDIKIVLTKDLYKYENILSFF